MSKFPKRYLPKKDYCICGNVLEALKPLLFCHKCGSDYCLSDDRNIKHFHFKQNGRTYLWIVSNSNKTCFGSNVIGDIANFDRLISFEEGKILIRKYLENKVFE